MKARVEQLSETIEELATLRVSDHLLTCFAHVCPYKLEVGQTYPVNLELYAADEYEVQEAEESHAPFERIGTSFAYWLFGRLEGGRFRVAEIDFDATELAEEHAHLDGSRIRVKLDRIHAEFLVE